MKREKICLVANLNDLSGSNRSLIDLCCVLIKEKIDFVVAVPRNGKIVNELKEKGIPYVILFYLTWIEKKENHIKWILKKIILFFSNVVFAVFCIYSKVGLVHYNSISVGVGSNYLNVLGIPYIWHIREILLDNYDFINKQKALLLLNKSKKVVFVSKTIKDKYKNTIIADPELIYNGINKTSSRNIYTNKEFKNIVTVGGVEENKNQLEIVKALKIVKKKYNDIKLFIVGPINDINYYNKINEYLIENNLENNVVFVGYTNKVSYIRKKCAIAIVSSKFESFGRSTVEAMSCGEIVIGSNIGATEEILDNKYTGIIYELSNYVQLSKEIVNVIVNRENTETIMINAYNKTKNKYDIQLTARKIINIYNKYVNATQNSCIKQI